MLKQVKAVYTEALLQHFREPRNAGQLPPPALHVEVCNPACGDTLILTARIENEVVVEAAYKVRGCTASIAGGSVLTELMKGRRVGEVRASDLESTLGGLPDASKHALALCMDAQRALCLKAGIRQT